MKTVVEITEMEHFGGIGFFFFIIITIIKLFYLLLQKLLLDRFGKKKKEGNLCIATDDVLKGMLEAHR